MSLHSKLDQPILQRTYAELSIVLPEKSDQTRLNAASTHHVIGCHGSKLCRVLPAAWYWAMRPSGLEAGLMKEFSI